MKSLATHSGKLERWLGKEAVESISDSMRDWYGPPIAVANVPGNVWAQRGGDFRGRVTEGAFGTALCYAEDSLKRRLPRAFRRWSRKQGSTLNAGFSSLSDLIAEMTAGKRQELAFQKVGTTGVTGASNSLWRVGNQPAAGAAAAAAPGGTAPTDATTGALIFNNPSVGGDTTHYIGANVLASSAGNTMLLYDRIFAVAKTMSSTATEAVTGVPSRYQNTTAGTVDSAEGNFLFVEVGSALGATAHNWTVCTYTDQSNNAGATLPSLTGNSGAIINRLDHPNTQWFAPLATGDTGIKALTQMQCSASVTGAIDFVIGHPLAWHPLQTSNTSYIFDGINTAVNLVRIFDDACLAMLEVAKSGTGACTYTGTITICAG